MDFIWSRVVCDSDGPPLEGHMLAVGCTYDLELPAHGNFLEFLGRNEFPKKTVQNERRTEMKTWQRGVFNLLFR